MKSSTFLGSAGLSTLLAFRRPPPHSSAVPVSLNSCSMVPHIDQLRHWYIEELLKGTTFALARHFDTVICEISTATRSLHCGALGGSMTHLRLVLHFRCELRFWRRFWRTDSEISLCSRRQTSVTRQWHHSSPRKKRGHTQQSDCLDGPAFSAQAPYPSFHDDSCRVSCPNLRVRLFNSVGNMWIVETVRSGCS